MFGLFKDVTKEPGPKLEQKILKSAREAFNFMLTSSFGDDYAGFIVMCEREELKHSFEKHLEKLAWEIGNSDNPRAFLRRNITRNTRTYVTFATLAQKENTEQKQFLFDQINLWLEKTKQSPDAWKTVGQILQEHEMFEHTFDDLKVAHELLWSEVEGLVLRQLQVVLFKESNQPENDWSAMYRDACERAVQWLYKQALDGELSEEGLPHPIVMLFSNDVLFDSAERVIACG